jgi:hypothetical protein
LPIPYHPSFTDILPWVETAQSAKGLYDQDPISGKIGDYSLRHHIRTILGPTSRLFKGYGGGALSTEAKRPVREAHHPPPPNIEFYNAWNLHPRLSAVLLRHRANFTFTHRISSSPT